MPAQEPTEKKPFPVRKVVGYSIVVLGVASLVAAGFEGVSWLSDKNKSDQDRNSVPSNVTDVCNPGMLDDAAVLAAADACKQSHNASSAVKFGWIFTGIGAVLAGTGIWLVVGDHSNDAPEPMAKAKGPKFDFLPVAGPHRGQPRRAHDVLSPKRPESRALIDAECTRQGGSRSSMSLPKRPRSRALFL